MNHHGVYKPIQFFFIAFLFSWSCWLTAAFWSTHGETVGYQMIFTSAGLFGPSVAALIALSGRVNRGLRRGFWHRCTFTTINPSFLPIMVLLPFCVILLATAVSLLFGFSADQFLFSAQYMVMSEHPLTSLIILSLAPIFEELGWRGYGVDSLRPYGNLISSSLLFGLLWAVWHAPLFFIRGYYHHTLWTTHWIYVVNFFLSVVAAAVLMNWIYFKNGRSILSGMIFHFMLNLAYVLFQTEPATKCLATLLLFVIILWLIARDKPFFLEKIEPPKRSPTTNS